MAKIAQVVAKYIIHASFEASGVVDRPDIIGAIFGQTEGLLGSDLELRELQRSGKIGRIDVTLDTKYGKTVGKITIPSSLDKAETCIIGAALEVVERIGPTNAKIKVDKIEDVRVSKRMYIIQRAKELLKEMLNSLPDSQEMANEVTESIRMMEIQEYGKERLAAGPNIDESDEIIIVEGRADVLNLLKHGFKNAIAINGTSVPETIIELSKKKIVTAFVDGDRGGNLILKELFSVADIDYVARAPDGKEVEELTKKEIHKALRGRISAEQVRLELGLEPQKKEDKKVNRQANNRQEPAKKVSSPQNNQKKELNKETKEKLRKFVEDLIGTRAAMLFDKDLNMLGKLPLKEVVPTLKSLKGEVEVVVLDGEVNKEIAQVAEKVGVSFLVGIETKIKNKSQYKVQLLTLDDLE